MRALAFSSIRRVTSPCRRHFSFSPCSFRFFSSVPTPTSSSSVLTDVLSPPSSVCPVYRVTLNRPSLHNAFNDTVISELHEAFTTRLQSVLSSNPDVRAVLLRSDGPSFSAGADLNYMKKMKTASNGENREDAERLFDMVRSISECPLPVLCRVQGSAFGGGVGLISACDMSFSLDSAVFGLTEVKLGLAPAVISKFVMNRIGMNAAKRYFLTGERFDARRAKDIGLISESFPTAEALDGAIDIVLKEIASAAPMAVRKTKKLIDTVSSMVSANETKDFVTTMISELRVATEGQEGLDAFLQKKKPSWATNAKKEK